MKKLYGNKGITLIALVITIILLIILAGVTISLTLGEEGLFNKVKDAKEQSTIESISEKLELVKGSDYVTEIGESTIDTYFISLDKEKIEPYEVTNKQKLTSTTAIIEADNKYSFLVIIENDNNINVKYEGKIEDIDRELPTIQISMTGSNSQTTLPIDLGATVTNNGENATSTRWVLNKSSDELGLEESLYTNTTDCNIDLDINEVGTYYIHTLTSDKYGRKQETIKGPITVQGKYHQHASGCYGPLTGTRTKYCGCSSWSYCRRDDGVTYCGNCGHNDGCGSGYCYRPVGTESYTYTGLKCGISTSAIQGYTVNY